MVVYDHSTAYFTTVGLHVWAAALCLNEHAVREASTICPAPVTLTQTNCSTLHADKLFVRPFDHESGVRVTCGVGYLCANFSLPRPLCSRLRPDVRDRQTSDSIIA